MSILFFTCATASYEDFIPLYAASVLAHAPDARLEFGVEDATAFGDRHRGAMAALTDAFDADRFLVRNVAWTLPDGRPIKPNSVRFLERPATQADHIYIGDVDIIVLDKALAEKHLADMDETGLPYSNSVRPGTRKMSGLHFAETRSHYPLPAVDDLDLATMNDEHLLYEIVRRKGQPIIEDRWFRPMHGIHISPNRAPHSRMGKRGLIPGWTIGPHATSWTRFSRQPFFAKLRPELSPRVRGCLDVIDAFCAERRAAIRARRVEG